MNEPKTIIRIAAKGDGVTTDGQHVKGGVPGDVLQADGTVTLGPHRVQPPCRHFAQCGGCQLQQVDEQELARFVTERVVLAAEGQGLVPTRITPAQLSPPGARRRATLHAMRKGKAILIG